MFTLFKAVSAVFSGGIVKNYFQYDFRIWYLMDKCILAGNFMVHLWYQSHTRPWNFFVFKTLLFLLKMVWFKSFSLLIFSLQAQRANFSFMASTSSSTPVTLSSTLSLPRSCTSHTTNKIENLVEYSYIPESAQISESSYPLLYSYKRPSSFIRSIRTLISTRRPHPKEYIQSFAWINVLFKPPLLSNMLLSKSPQSCFPIRNAKVILIFILEASDWFLPFMEEKDYRLQLALPCLIPGLNSTKMLLLALSSQLFMQAVFYSPFIQTLTFLSKTPICPQP